MSLESHDYNLKNALTWGLAGKHLEKAMSSEKNGHVWKHLTLFIIQAIPVLGQIVSLFELLVVKQMGIQKDQKPSELKNKRVQVKPQKDAEKTPRPISENEENLPSDTDKNKPKEMERHLPEEPPKNSSEVMKFENPKMATIFKFQEPEDSHQDLEEHHLVEEEEELHAELNKAIALSLMQEAPKPVPAPAPVTPATKPAATSPATPPLTQALAAQAPAPAAPVTAPPAPAAAPAAPVKAPAAPVKAPPAPVTAPPAQAKASAAPVAPVTAPPAPAKAPKATVSKGAASPSVKSSQNNDKVKVGTTTYEKTTVTTSIADFIAKLDAVITVHNTRKAHPMKNLTKNFYEVKIFIFIKLKTALQSLQGPLSYEIFCNANPEKMPAFPDSKDNSWWVTYVSALPSFFKQNFRKLEDIPPGRTKDSTDSFYPLVSQSDRKNSKEGKIGKIVHTVFGDEKLGGGVTTTGCAQEELEFLANGAFSFVMDGEKKSRVGPKGIGGTSLPRYIKGAKQLLQIHSQKKISESPNAPTFYGRDGFNNIKTEGTHLDNFVTQLENPEDEDLLVLVAPDLRGYSHCPGINNSVPVLSDLLYTLALGFQTAKDNAGVAPDELVHIDSGKLGCGIFGNNPTAVYVLSYMAADLTGVDLTLHGYSDQEYYEAQLTWSIIKPLIEGQSLNDSVYLLSIILPLIRGYISNNDTKEISLEKRDFMNYLLGPQGDPYIKNHAFKMAIGNNLGSINDLIANLPKESDSFKILNFISTITPKNISETLTNELYDCYAKSNGDYTSFLSNFLLQYERLGEIEKLIVEKAKKEDCSELKCLADLFGINMVVDRAKNNGKNLKINRLIFEAIISPKQKYSIDKKDVKDFFKSVNGEQIDNRVTRNGLRAVFDPNFLEKQIQKLIKNENTISEEFAKTYIKLKTGERLNTNTIKKLRELIENDVDNIPSDLLENPANLPTLISMIIACNLGRIEEREKTEKKKFLNQSDFDEAETYFKKLKSNKISLNPREWTQRTLKRFIN